MSGISRKNYILVHNNIGLKTPTWHTDTYLVVSKCLLGIIKHFQLNFYFKHLSNNHPPEYSM